MLPTLGSLVRGRRQQLGLTQAQLATHMGHGTTQIHISRLETGTTALPRWPRLLALAAALGVTAGDLLVHGGLVTADALQVSNGGLVLRCAARHPRPLLPLPISMVREWEPASVIT